MPDFVSGGGESEFLVVKLERGTDFFLIRKWVLFFLFPELFVFEEIFGFSLICSVFRKESVELFCFSNFLKLRFLGFFS